MPRGPMKPLTVLKMWLTMGAPVVALVGGGCVFDFRGTQASTPASQAAGSSQATRIPQPAPDQVVISSPPGVARPPFSFSAEDDRLLDDVEHGAFMYLWNVVSPETGMVHDRSSKAVVSVAGVGFELSAIPVGISRAWIAPEEGRVRALKILRALAGNAQNRKAGLFYHYLDPATAGPSAGGYERVVSTIDSALLFAGVITASAYFGGEVAEIGNKIIQDADWRFYVLTEGEKPYELGYISLGWKPDANDEPAGAGKLLPYVWADCGDEHRLVTFLAAAAPLPAHRADAGLYYKLRRRLGQDDGSGPMAWFPWSGALFTHFFAHCWINYSAMGPDNPAAFGQAHRARVDWWENSRRAVAMHRRKCAANPKGLPTLSVYAWGLSASDSPSGYSVPGLFPTPLPIPGGKPEFDYSTFNPKDDYGDGTIAPYAAGCSVMFDPVAAVEALRYYRTLQGADGAPLVWRDPDAPKRQFGFLDSFNLGKEWVAADYVAIDEGPLVLAIENARTGQVWKTFGSSAVVRDGYARLRFDPPVAGQK